jgi:hypothetical protein
MVAARWHNEEYTHGVLTLSSYFILNVVHIFRPAEVDHTRLATGPHQISYVILMTMINAA